MAQPVKPAAKPIQSHGAAVIGTPRENHPSNNLWIGNVSPDVSDSELKALFESHGEVLSVTSFPSRSYAFVYFKEIEGAKSARQGLQGHFLRGNRLKIEFENPAKPCNILWVARISQSVTKEELEKEFLKFGKIREFRFLKDRNTAYIDYIRLEDATWALKSMNGKQIGGDQIHVDFLKSQSSRREQGLDAKEGHFPSRNLAPSEFRWMTEDSLKNYPEPGLAGTKRQSQFPHIGSQVHGSKVLRISYPPSVVIEEHRLYNAMILYGDIERINISRDMQFAFVEFRSFEEAQRAKQGLQGKIFNDPRIFIDYFCSELGHQYPGVKAQCSEFQFRPVHMDILGLSRPVLPGHLPSLRLRGPDVYMRPPLLSPHFTFKPTLPGPDKPGCQTLIGGKSWRSSPAPGIVSSPSAGFSLPNRYISGAWDVSGSSELQRESKRSRFDATSPPERTENKAELDKNYGLNSISSGGALGSLTSVATGGLGQLHAESDCIWRGTIAKGGTPVCHARCVPIGEGIDAHIPEVINCSARTGLDLLSKRYDNAIGFNVVFFLPDGEEDFASYTEFLRYLVSKDRAGVAKFDDGTTLFLVPPSDFVTKVLNVSGPDRLYGLVLKFPHVVSSSTSMNPQSIQPQYGDTSLQTGYSAVPPKERVSPMDYSMDLTEDSKLPPKASGPVSSCLHEHSLPPTAMASQPGFALTPELIATLTSLLPANNVSSGLQSMSLPQTSSKLEPTSNVTPGPNIGVTHWKHGHQVPDHHGQPVQQLGSQIKFQLQHVTQAEDSLRISNMSSHFHQFDHSDSQMRQCTINFPHQWAISSKSMAPVIPLQNGSVTVVPEMNLQYQQGSSQGIDHETDASRFCSSSNVQQLAYPVPLSNQVHCNDISKPQPCMPLPSEVERKHQSQQLQTGPHGDIQERTKTEADKIERYKATLLFAANLLSRIHQPPGNQPGRGMRRQ